MSKKTILLALCGVILIGSALYVAGSVKNSHMLVATTHSKVIPREDSQSPIVEKVGATNTVPDKNATNETILNYLIDILPHEEMEQAGKILDATSSPYESDVAIGTNF